MQHQRSRWNEIRNPCSGTTPIPNLALTPPPSPPPPPSFQTLQSKDHVYVSNCGSKAEPKHTVCAFCFPIWRRKKLWRYREQGKDSRDSHMVWRKNYKSQQGRWWKQTSCPWFVHQMDCHWLRNHELMRTKVRACVFSSFVVAFLYINSTEVILFLLPLSCGVLAANVWCSPMIVPSAGRWDSGPGPLKLPSKSRLLVYLIQSAARTPPAPTVGIKVAKKSTAIRCWEMSRSLLSPHSGCKQVVMSLILGLQVIKYCLHSQNVSLTLCTIKT